MSKPHNTIERLKASFDGLRYTSTFRFFGLAFLAYVLWSVAYEQVLKPSTTLDEVVIEHMVSSTEAVFELVGWPVGTYPQPATHRDRVGVAGHAGVQIGAPCDGVALFALFAIFILAFPGPLARKAWFIPAGVALLHLANIGRVVVLTRIQATSPEWLEFNHDYTFTVLIYGLVFALWYLWTVRGRPSKRLAKDRTLDPQANS
jgi:exosortase family protein XrtF